MEGGIWCENFTQSFPIWTAQDDEGRVRLSAVECIYAESWMGIRVTQKKRRQIERNCKVLLLHTAPKLSVKRAEELWQELQGTQEDHGFRQPKTGLG